MNYRIRVCYDGTRYHGWQKQGNSENTIQGRLENVLSRAAGRPVEVIGAGRTDAGVHALGQTANFHLDTDLSPEELQTYLNTYLPEDIGVSDIETVPERFHSRYSAHSKIYRYVISKDKAANIFERKTMWAYYETDLAAGAPFKTLNLPAMRAAASCLIGKHDFRCFCGNKHFKKSTTRTICRIDIEESASALAFTYEGDGFLPYMVRIMTGTLLEIGNGSRSPESVRVILESGLREEAGMMVPARGLTLVRVNYD